MVGKIKRIAEMAYLESEKLALLKQLSKDLRIPRSVLLREAVDDLLIKHKMMRPAKKKS